MRELTGKEKATVRKVAQKYKAEFQVGAKDIHQGNIDAINEGFNSKEVMKIKVNREDIYDKKIVGEIAQKLEKELKCQIAGIIGTTIIIYKEHKDEDKRMFI